MRILYIDIDSLRPDHLGCYGYARRTSPHIDAIAAEGVRFDNCYASDTPCLPSRTALFSGQFGIHTGVVNHGGLRADLRPQGAARGFRSQTAEYALAERLRMAGWYTATISPFPHRHTAYQMTYGFHETFDTGHNGGEPADLVYPYAERWLRQNRDRDRWFLHLNLWDPHTPYVVPLSYGEPFRDAPPPAWLTQETLDRQRLSYGPHDAVTPHGMEQDNPGWPRGCGTIRDLRDWKRWIDGYDTGIHFADHHVGRIVAELKRLGLYEDTAIILSSDHGENQGELEIYGDHQTADQITNRIPLIVRWPGLTDDKRGAHYDGLHYNLDLASTLVELTGGTQPGPWDGLSFAETLRSGAERGREFLVLSQGAWSCQRSIRWKEHLLIRTYHTGHKNFPALMLFNLREDPHEQHNLAPRRPDLVGEGLTLLDGWVAQQLRRSGQPDPLFEVIAEGGPLHANTKRLKSFCERLRRTGRSEHARWLEEHDGQPREDGASNFAG